MRKRYEVDGMVFYGKEITDWKEYAKGAAIMLLGTVVFYFVALALPLVWHS